MAMESRAVDARVKRKLQNQVVLKIDHFIVEATLPYDNSSSF